VALVLDLRDAIVGLVEGSGSAGKLRVGPSAAGGPERVASLAGGVRHAAGAGAAQPWIYTPVLVAAFVALILPLGALAFGWPRPRWTRGLALTAGALPGAAFLANLVPWWNAGGGRPAWQTATYAAVTLGIALALAAASVGLASAVRRRWPWPGAGGRDTAGATSRGAGPEGPPGHAAETAALDVGGEDADGLATSRLASAEADALAPAGWIAGATAIVLACDAVAGSPMAWDGPLGLHSLHAARLYGFGNNEFAWFAAAALVAAALGLGPLTRRRRGRAGAAIVLVGVGLVTAAIDGAPQWGSDFGGPIALVAGFAVAALLAARIRLTWVRAGVVLVAGVVVLGAIAVADWLRGPASWTHIGAFVEDVAHGGAGGVIMRKISQWGLMAALTVPVLAVLAVVGVIVWRRIRCSEEVRAYGRAAPLAAAALAGLATLLVIGAVINDAGTAILGIGASLAGPLLAAGLTARGRESGARPI
jgi:hypothetical protein